MAIFVALENEGLRTPGPSCIPSELFSSTFPSASWCLASSKGRSLPSGVCVSAGSLFVVLTAFEGGITEAFLRVLNENFFGGLKVLRMACSFSDSALIV
jgi:hypothetical protein